MLVDALECSICLEQLNIDNRVLPCQHTFCTTCLEAVKNKEQERFRYVPLCPCIDSSIFVTILAAYPSSDLLLISWLISETLPINKLRGRIRTPCFRIMWQGHPDITNEVETM